MSLEELKEELKNKVIQEIDITKELKDDDILERIDQVIFKESDKRYLCLEKKIKLRSEIFNSIRRLDVLQELIENDKITEIMVNGYDRIFIEEQGNMYQWPGGFSSKEKLYEVIQQVVAGANRIVNESSPIVDARLKDGSRVNVVLNPISIDGSTMTIRKFPNNPLDMKKLVEMGAITKQAAEDLKILVKSGYNIFISGGTGSGKTTFLNALSSYIESDERVITIEDSAELKLLGIENLIRLEVRNANVEGTNQITIRDLIKASLRMRPSRIIVGEVRGEEAMDMLQAFNTGHSGFSTGHANSSFDMLSRIETMALTGMDMPLAAIRGQVASAIDIIVHLGRLRDKSRRVLEICEIDRYKNGEILLNTLYKFEEDGEENGRVVGRLKMVDTLIHKTKLKLAGYEEVYEENQKGGQS